MRVEIQYIDDCPTWRDTEALVRDAAVQLGIELETSLRRVATADEAVELSFRGSPTILIDGTDPFLDELAPIGLACRIYETDDGFAGAPTAAQVTEALAAST